MIYMGAVVETRTAYTNTLLSNLHMIVNVAIQADNEPQYADDIVALAERFGILGSSGLRKPQHRNTFYCRQSRVIHSHPSPSKAHCHIQVVLTGLFANGHGRSSATSSTPAPGASYCRSLTISCVLGQWQQLRGQKYN